MAGVCDDSATRVATAPGERGRALFGRNWRRLEFVRALAAALVECYG